MEEFCMLKQQARDKVSIVQTEMQTEENGQGGGPAFPPQLGADTEEGEKVAQQEDKHKKEKAKELRRDLTLRRTNLKREMTRLGEEEAVYMEKIYKKITEMAKFSKETQNVHKNLKEDMATTKSYMRYHMEAREALRSAMLTWEKVFEAEAECTAKNEQETKEAAKKKETKDQTTQTVQIYQDLRDKGTEEKSSDAAEEVGQQERGTKRQREATGSGQSTPTGKRAAQDEETPPGQVATERKIRGEDGTAFGPVVGQENEWRIAGGPPRRKTQNNGETRTLRETTMIRKGPNSRGRTEA